jgi:hypothetical protein
LKELITSGAVPSLQVVDTEGRHPLNLAVQGQHMDTVQVGRGRRRGKGHQVGYKEGKGQQARN